MKQLIFAVKITIIITIISCTQDDVRPAKSEELLQTAQTNIDFETYTERWLDAKNTAFLDGYIKNLTPDELVIGFTYDRHVFSSILKSNPRTAIYFGLGIDDTNKFVILPKASQKLHQGHSLQQPNAFTIKATTRHFDHKRALQITEPVYANKRIATLPQDTKKHLITPLEASKLITKWNTIYSSSIAPNLASLVTINGERLRGFTLERTAMENMLASKNLHAITAYIAIKKDQNRITLVLVGEDAQGVQLMPDATKTNENDAGNLLLEYISPCPATC